MSGARERLQHIDVLKGLAVAAVVVGHSGAPLPVAKVLYSFHLPVFFFVAGFLFSDRYFSDLKQLLVRRIRTLYIPYVLWGVGYLCFHNVFFRSGLYSETSGYMGDTDHLFATTDFMLQGARIFAFYGTERMAGALWFLESLFTAIMLFGIVGLLAHRTSRPEYAIPVLVGVLLLVGYSNALPLRYPAHLNTSLVAVYFVYLGYVARRYERRLLAWPALAALGVAVVLLSQGGIKMGSNSYESLAVLMLVPFAGIIACFHIAKILENSRVLSLLGRYSLFVIATHFLAFKLVSWCIISVEGLSRSALAEFPVITGDAGWWVAYSFVGLFAPLAARTVIAAAPKAYGTLVPRGADRVRVPDRRAPDK